jgi:hypothetical protein
MIALLEDVHIHVLPPEFPEAALPADAPPALLAGHGNDIGE